MDRRPPDRQPARRFGLFAVSGALGAGLAAFLLVPALLEVEESKGSLFAMAFSLTPLFDLSELPYGCSSAIFSGTM